MVAAYLAKYATKSTEVTGHVSGRLNDSTIDLYADPDGTHTERLVDACWMLGTPRDWRRLRQWAHMFGFGGHFFTKVPHLLHHLHPAPQQPRRLPPHRDRRSGPRPDRAPSRRPRSS